MSSTYQFKKQVELHHIDAAGVVFYGEIFYFVHDAFAHFLRDQGHSIKDTLEKRDYVFPVVDAQATYKHPIYLEDEVVVDLKVSQITESSFTIQYKLSVHNNLVATAQVIHAVIDSETHKKKALPKLLLQALGH